MQRVTMEYAITMLVCLIGISAAIEMECPRPEWKQRRSHNTCYWFEEGDRLPQYKADERCRRYSGKLVKIDDMEENDWILKNVVPQAKTRIGGNSEYYFIGLKRTGSNVNSWYWEVDGSGLDWGGNWLSGEPNNHHNKENCVTYYENTGQWNDVMCGDNFHYICEYQIPVPY